MDTGVTGRRTDRDWLDELGAQVETIRFYGPYLWSITLANEPAGHFPHLNFVGRVRHVGQSRPHGHL